MFGLTKREQRWKAEQRAAETLAGIAIAAINARHGKATEMNKAEELIACLEGEIAKRDEELVACRVAVENCDVFRARIAELEERNESLEFQAQHNYELANKAANELAALKAQEPVEYQLRALIRDVTNIPEAGYYMPQSWHDQVIALSLSGKLDAPVSEAKAQVVMPEPDFLLDSGAAPCYYAETVRAALNAAPVQQVSVPACVTCCDVGIVGHSMLCPECSSPSAAPAAPAADAGVTGHDQ